MKRLLMIGETPQMQTLYATYIRELGFRLSCDGYVIGCIGFNYTGWPFKNDKISYPLYPWVGPPYNPLNINEVVKEFKPDALLLFGPPVLFSWIKDCKLEVK